VHGRTVRLVKNAVAELEKIFLTHVARWTVSGPADSERGGRRRGVP
jgi:hypothetical protein